MNTSITDKKAIEYFETNKKSYLNQLVELAKIPSVSFKGFEPKEVVRSAEFVAKALNGAGLENVELMQVEDSHPYVYADWLHAEKAPTILLYAHHDVQPPLREAVWNTPPFEPTEKNGRLFGRGTADDKAGIIIHIASLEAFLKTEGKLPVNVKLIIEGEEETGSQHLEKFLAKYADKLKADCLVIADLSNYDVGIPSITSSLRGLATMELSVRALSSPLHSGMWGGPIPDPIMGLSKMLSSLTDDNGQIAVPGILEQVIPPNEEEINDIHSLNMTNKEFASQIKMVDSLELIGKDGELLEKIWKYPSLSINSIESGGKKIAGNVIMDSAWARIGLRTVAGMDADKCLSLIEQHLKAHCPWGLELTVEKEAGVNAWKTPVNHPVFGIMKQAMETGYQKKPVFIGCGGTIPFVAPITQMLGGIPALLIGIEDPLTNAHSENESLGIDDFLKACLSQIEFFRLVGEKSNIFEGN